MSVLRVRDLSVRYGQETRRAVDRVALDVAPGECLGIVGESGSGKSTAVLALLRLLGRNGSIEGGSAMLEGVGDLLSLEQHRLRQVRGGTIGFVRQNPFSVLQPTLSLEHQFRNMIRAHEPRVARAVVRERACDAMTALGLRDPASLLRAYAHELSGGMAQRVVIAMATIHRPRLLVADEPTTGLDLTVQRRVLDLLAERLRDTHASAILVSHDLAVVANYCDRVVVMYRGRVVEDGPVGDVLATPAHPYTRALLAAIPRGKTFPAVPAVLTDAHGEFDDSACAYAARCPMRFDLCLTAPTLETSAPGRRVACHLCGKDASHAAARV